MVPDMKDIQRYNQGFGGFGPLEKCKDGRLVFFDEASRAAQMQKQVAEATLLANLQKVHQVDLDAKDRIIKWKEDCNVAQQARIASLLAEDKKNRFLLNIHLLGWLVVLALGVCNLFLK